MYKAFLNLKQFLKLLQTGSIIGSIVILILAGVILIPPAVVTQSLVSGAFSKKSIFVLNSYHPTNPTYTYISNIYGDDSKKDRIIAVIELERPNIFLPYFQVSKTLVGGKTQGLNLKEATDYTKNNDLVKYNPAPDKILVPSQNLIELEEQEKNMPKLTSEDRYYLEYSTYSDLKKMSVNDFKKLKRGMTWGEIESSGFDYDNARSSGLLSNKYERRARVQESDIMFIVMAFAEDVDDKNPNAPLEDVYIVYSDRSNKKLDLESK